MTVGMGMGMAECLILMEHFAWAVLKMAIFHVVNPCHLFIPVLP
jgi:hypothetical protein